MAVPEQLEDEERAKLRDLLGFDAVQNFDALRGRGSALDGRFAFLSQDKRFQLNELDRQYQQKREILKAQQQAGQLTFEEENNQLAELEKSKEEATQKLLSPEELQEYKLRNSQHAYALAVGRAAFKV